MTRSSPGRSSRGDPSRRFAPLCETYGIARATAGKAIHMLADEGLIRRVPGKGWFVTPKAEGPYAVDMARCLETAAAVEAARTERSTG